MECEICGKPAAKTKKIELDGSTFIVCKECAAFGKEMEKPAAGSAVTIAPAPGFSRSLREIRRPGYAAEKMDLGTNLLPDYGRVIRKARERKKLTVKELARKIFEKESLLHRVEGQAIKPSDSLIAKLEKQLGIKLKKQE